MTGGKRFGALLVTLLAIMPGLVAAKGRPFGSITGVVRDEVGNPIIGAVIKLIDPNAIHQPAKIIRTDMEGKFVARKIAPGPYRLRAEARGFISMAQPIEVKPEVILSFKFELKRTGTMAQSREDRDDYRWPVRASRRHVLRFDRNGESAAEGAIANLGAGRSDWRRGMIQIGIPLGKAQSRGLSNSLNFAVVNDVAPHVQVVVVGQGGTGERSRNRLEVLTSSSLDKHQLTLAVGMATLQPIGTADVMARQLSLRLADHWQVAEPLMIIYGVDLTRLMGAGSRLNVGPRLGLKLSATDRTHVIAEFFPVTSQEIQSIYQYEGGEIVFTEPETLAILQGRPEPDRSRRLQVGVTRLLSEESNLEVTLFMDEISGRGVGVLAVPAEAPNQPEEAFQTITQRGRTTGVRLTYAHRLADLLTATLGCAFGQGQKLSADGLAGPANFLARNLFQVFLARLDAAVPWTRTRISATFRAVPRTSVFGIDPFYGDWLVLDPGLSVMVTQELPTLAFLPGRWEATVDARNLFDVHNGVSTHTGSVQLSRFCRSIRGSFSVRF